MRGKAQSAVEVTLIVLILAIGMVGYVILLPEDARNELLDDDTTSITDDSDVDGEVLLSESPGSVSPSKSSSHTRSLEPIRLYSTSESNTKALATSITISKSIIGNNYKSIQFDIDNLEELENLELLFFASEYKGNLRIKLNDQLVYDSELNSADLPLALPTDALVSEGNVLEFSTDFSWNVFSPNYYILQDLQLIQDYLVEDKSTTRTFSIDNPEDISSVVLNYFVTCNSNDRGILTISLNNREVFSDTIFCEYLNKRELLLDDNYLATSNTLKFEITKGDYNLEEIQITEKTRAQDYPSFSFDLDNDMYQEIASGDKDIYLKLTFDDDTTDKEATVYVQDYSFDFNTDAMSYERKISSYVDDGANTITIEPLESFKISNLKVYVN
ncbi:hypothetical protein J4467_00320 [Candidatus Woesearchaeota archaeon]|nr:hypothetical protein [Candidatus Woesearchaeota archaeon]